MKFCHFSFLAVTFTKSSQSPESIGSVMLLQSNHIKALLSFSPPTPPMYSSRGSLGTQAIITLYVNSIMTCRQTSVVYPSAFCIFQNVKLISDCNIKSEKMYLTLQLVCS